MEDNLNSAQSELLATKDVTQEVGISPMTECPGLSEATQSMVGNYIIRCKYLDGCRFPNGTKCKNAGSCQG